MRTIGLVTLTFTTFAMWLGLGCQSRPPVIINSENIPLLHIQRIVSVRNSGWNIEDITCISAGSVSHKDASLYVVTRTLLHSRVRTGARDLVCYNLLTNSVVWLIDNIGETQDPRVGIDDMLRIGESPRIDLSNHNHMMIMSGITAGDLVNISSATDVAARALTVAIKSWYHGDESEVQLYQPDGSLVDLASMMADIPKTCVISIQIKVPEIDAVRVPRLRLSKYWEAEIEAILAVSYDGVHENIILRVGVLGSSVETDRVDRVVLLCGPLGR